MKINRNSTSYHAAQNILKFLRGDFPAEDFNVSVNNGDLLFNSNIHPIQDDETVLIDRLESDSMGDGWDDESATPGKVIEWLENNCEA